MKIHNHSDRPAKGKNRTPQNWCHECKRWMLPAMKLDRRPILDSKEKAANDCQTD